jgi:voltage-gated potassium channel
MSTEHSFRDKVHEIIFEADTPAGKWFDIILLFAILASVVAVMLESVVPIELKYGDVLLFLEWTFTILFTVEYFLRIYATRKASSYIFSFYGIIDFLSIIPTYLSLLVSGTVYLMVIRSIRLIRVFRILKLTRYVREASRLMVALRASGRKILVFLFFVLMTTIILGTVMYLVEGPENGFRSIPLSIYWTIVTLTTVGYGDISPQTPLGQFIASFVMIIGYGIIAVPTGIVSVQIARTEDYTNTQVCRHCGSEDHKNKSKYCYSCGKPINAGRNKNA